MSRQIRISIEDDEVFERLKRRKDALDLSWEDVLRRGLRDGSRPPRPPQPSRTHRPQDHGGNERHDRERSGHAHERRHHDRARGRRGGHHAAQYSPFDPEFGARLAESIRSSIEPVVRGNVEGAFETAGEEDLFGGEHSLDDEIGRLEDAEDAVLVLGEDDAHRVPLRVELRTGPEGLDVNVVAVRKGKSTAGMNRFDGGARATVAQRFATGETAQLELGDGGESYDVRPDLTWARGPDGTPVVADVAIREVRFEE